MRENTKFEVRKDIQKKGHLCTSLFHYTGWSGLFHCPIHTSMSWAIALLKRHWSSTKVQRRWVMKYLHWGCAADLVLTIRAGTQRISFSHWGCAADWSTIRAGAQCISSPAWFFEKSVLESAEGIVAFLTYRADQGRYYYDMDALPQAPSRNCASRAARQAVCRLRGLQQHLSGAAKCASQGAAACKGPQVSCMQNP